MSEYTAAEPRIAAHVILRDGDKIAMLLRKNTDWMNDHWGLLAGKVEKNESFVQAAIREAKEEGGVTLTAGQLRPVLFAHIHDGSDGWISAVFEVTEWQGEAYNAEPHVHETLKWFDINEVPENTVPNVRKYLEAIIEGDTYIEIDW